MISVVPIEHTAALFYSWSIRYIVSRAPLTYARGSRSRNSPYYVVTDPTFSVPRHY